MSHHVYAVGSSLLIEVQFRPCLLDWFNWAFDPRLRPTESSRLLTGTMHERVFFRCTCVWVKCTFTGSIPPVCAAREKVTSLLQPHKQLRCQRMSRTSRGKPLWTQYFPRKVLEVSEVSKLKELVITSFVPRVEINESHIGYQTLSLITSEIQCTTHTHSYTHNHTHTTHTHTSNFNHKY